MALPQLKPTDVKGFSKDPENKAVVNTDTEALQAYRLRREKQQRADAVLDDINSLKKVCEDQQRQIDDLRDICVLLLRAATDSKVNFNG